MGITKNFNVNLGNLFGIYNQQLAVDGCWNLSQIYQNMFVLHISEFNLLMYAMKKFLKSF